METGVNMSETTTEDEQAHERGARKRKALAIAVAVSVLCLLGIVVGLRVWRFIDAKAHRHTDEA